MAEQEVIKHAKKGFSVWNNSAHSFWHKMKEFITEILIIVFAISLSIWFHNWSEHKNEQAQVKTFLLGLRKDISSDINDAKELKHYFLHFDTTYKYLSSLQRNKRPDKDSLKQMLPEVRYNIYLRPHKSRFTGFLSAGKIMTIEEDSLALQILDYYQEVLPSVTSSESAWVTANAALQDYLRDNVKDIDSDMAKWEVLTSPKGKYLTKSLIPWQQIFDRYDSLILAGGEIISKIDKIYPEKK